MRGTRDDSAAASRVYPRWVAEGESPRFELNTTDGLDKVLAGAIAIRDRPPDFNPFGLLPVEASHGPEVLLSP